ncbi:hypothetical protein AWENTII_002307 [Aspergillus wentii]
MQILPLIFHNKKNIIIDNINHKMTKPNIAFIGLGAMGMGMALHLLEDGFPVAGFDLNPKALETLKSKGGSAATSPRECVQDCEIVVGMVANAKQTEAAFFTESTGAVWGLTSNATIILCSTFPPEFPAQVQTLLRTQFDKPDVSVIDCPVSGGTVRAAQGALTILSSGAATALERANPVLRSMSQHLYEIPGGLGWASKVKLINQQLAGIHIAVAAEAMGFAVTLGLNTKAVYEGVVGSAANSWMFENRVPHMLADDWTPYSALDIFVKDMGIVTAEGHNHQFPLFLSSVVEQFYLLGARMGYGKEDDSGLVRVFCPNGSVSASSENENAVYIQAIHELLEIVHTFAAVEALALSQRIQLPLKELVSIISTAAGSSESFKRVAANMLDGDISTGAKIADSRAKLVRFSSIVYSYSDMDRTILYLWQRNSSIRFL